MMCSLKKMLTAAAASLVVVTGLSASYDDSRTSIECFQPCAPKCCPSGNWYFNADLLVWRATEAGLGYGVQTETAFCNGCSVDNLVVNSYQRVKSVKPKWDCGFRIGVGYDLPCDCWDVGVYWTRFKTNHSSRHNSVLSHSNQSDDINFTPFGFALTNEPDVTFAKWNLRLDIIDVELGREFALSKCLTIRPFAGFRYARVQQKLAVAAAANRDALPGDNTGCSDSFIDSGFSSVDFFGENSKRSHFWGAGVRSGLDSEWDLGCGVSIYGTAAISILYGNYSLRTTAFEDFENIDGFTDVDVHARHRDQFNSCQGIADGAVGLRWKKFFDCDCGSVTLDFGWEQHLFLNHNKMENFSRRDTQCVDGVRVFTQLDSQDNRGDLCFSGFVVKATFEY